MSHPIHTVIESLEGSYPSADQARQVLVYCESVPARLAVSEEVAAVEKQVVQQVVRAMREKYPEFEGHHGGAWGKAFRDIQLTLRVSVQAMILDSTDFQDEKLLNWLRTILASFGMTPRFNRDTYRFLRDELAQRLSPRSFELLEPFLDRNIEVLSDFPEPAVARV